MDPSSLVLPIILGISNNSPTREPSNESDQESEGRTLDRIILINPITQGMIVIEGSRSLESLLLDAVNKEGLPPASKASMEAMPIVEITKEDLDKECSICLEGWEIGGEAREMPCKHRYHEGCIEKWLKMHGSCPVCRFEMPNDEEECRKRGRGGGGGGGGRDGEDGEERGRRADLGEIWVTFSFSNSRDGNRDSTTTTSTTTTTITESSPDSSPNAANHEEN